MSGVMKKTAARRGFTLIEILIAATVLGLGVLGIATLFAGAARQQQLAFDQSSTQRVTNNIDALLSDRFERFGGPALVRDSGTIDNPPFIAPGQWQPLASVPFGGLAGQRLAGSLSLDRSDNGQADQSAFGLARGSDVIFYRAPWADSNDVDQALSAAWGTASTAYLEANLDTDLVRLAPYPVLHPDFTIRVTYASETDPGLGTGPVGPGPVGPGGMANPLIDGGSVDFTFANRQDISGPPKINAEIWPADEAYAPGVPQTETTFTLYAPSESDDDGDGNNNTLNVSGSNISQLQVRVQPADDIQSPVSFLNLGSIKIRRPDDTTDGYRHIVREIRLQEPRYREDRLLSLDERLGYTDDAAFQGGRRPSRGAAVLYRRTLDGRDQLLTMSYTLEPLGRVRFDAQDEVPFVPPDTFERLYESMSTDPAEYGLLSQVELELGFVEATKRYTLTALNEEDEWAVERGQIVIVASKDDRVDPQAADRDDDLDPGAEFPVRVTSTRRDDMDRLVAVLDDSPRVSPARGGLRSMLEDRTTTETVWAWALRDVVRSAAGGDEDVDWRVRPTGARVVTLGGLR